MPAPKGNRNNANGRKFAGAVRRALHDRAALQGIANKLVDLALSGEAWAIREIGDRIDGKPAQTTELNVTTRQAPQEMDEAELDRRIAALTAREAGTDSGEEVASGVH